MLNIAKDKVGGSFSSVVSWLVLCCVVFVSFSRMRGAFSPHMSEI